MKVHFIAIGGSVMHQLAIALKGKGYAISGSDDEIFEPSGSNLAKAGLLPSSIGWDAGKITPDLDAVILGMHAKSDNPELVKARQEGLKIYSFPEYIYAESKNKKRVVIGGSHGKTTTTAMIMHVLRQTGKDFDYLVGARLEGFEQSVRITEAPVIICEGDEYPASILEKRPKFHFLFPDIAVLTGIAWDHINVFPTFENYLEQFKIFIEKIEPGGLLIYNETDPVLKQLVLAANRTDLRYQPYGLPEYHIADGMTTITLEGLQGRLKVFGNHNLLNIEAARYVCGELGTRNRDFLAAIGSFTGASKRLERVASGEGTSIFRDFAHAPSKVKASIEALKQQYPERRLIAVLELHTYSSLNESFMPEYRGAMDMADLAVVFYAKHALELKRMPALPAEKVKAGFAKPGLLVINTAAELEQWFREQDFQQTNLLLMSSGNYDGLDIKALAARLTGV